MKELREGDWVRLKANFREDTFMGGFVEAQGNSLLGLAFWSDGGGIALFDTSTGLFTKPAWTIVEHKPAWVADPNVFAVVDSIGTVYVRSATQADTWISLKTMNSLPTETVALQDKTVYARKAD